MKVSDRLDLVDKIGREIQSRYTFSEVDDYLGAFGVSAPDNAPSNSKWAYVRAALRTVELRTVLNIAVDLGLPVPNSVAKIAAEPPRNWKAGDKFRLFVSHLSADKDKATRLKDCLAPHGVAAFVAHEDIHPTLEWQIEIERGLSTMDALVALITPGFSKSVWTQQEIGFALGRGTAVISVKMGEDPPGFIARQQALARRNRKAEEIAKEICRLLEENPLTRQRYLETHDIPF